MVVKKKVVVVIGLLLCMGLCACGKKEEKKDDGFFSKVKDKVAEEVESAASHKMLKFAVNKKLDSAFTVESGKGNTVTFAYSGDWEQNNVSVEDGSTYYSIGFSSVNFTFGDEYTSELLIAVNPITSEIDLDSSSSLEDYEKVLNSEISNSGLNIADKTIIYLDESVNMPCLSCKYTEKIDDEKRVNVLFSTFVVEDMACGVIFMSDELDYDEMEEMYSNLLNNIKIDVGYSLDF